MGKGPFPVTVMSERGELHGTAYKDCTEASAMMLRAHAGGDFPLGWTDEEREALQWADGKGETGATMDDIMLSMQRRWGWTGDAVIAPLNSALRRKDGVAFHLAGANGNLPVGHRLRRWQPSFTGGHAWFVRPYGDGARVWVLDPLAPQGYAGDIATVEDVVKWAWGPDYARETMAGSLEASMTYVIYNDEVESIRTGRFLKGTEFFADYEMKNRLGALGADVTVQIMGYRGSALAIQVTTGTPYADKLPRPTLVFVNKAKLQGAVTITKPLDPTVVLKEEITALKAKNIALTGEVAALGSKINSAKAILG